MTFYEGNIYKTRCLVVREGVAGLDSLLLRFKSILTCLSNAGKAPEEEICRETLIFLWEEGHLCPFGWQSTDVYLFPRPRSHSEMGGLKSRSQKWTKMFSPKILWDVGHKSGCFRAQKTKWGMHWSERPSLLLVVEPAWLWPMRPEGEVHFSAAQVLCRLRSMGTAPGQKWHLGMSEGTLSGAVPVITERAGADFSPTQTRHVQGISGTPGWGKGRALQVGTMGEQTLNYCY